MKKLKKTTPESFVKSSCFFYSSGKCAALLGARETNKNIKAKCEPASTCRDGVEIKTFVDSIKTPDSNLAAGTAALSRYVT